VWLMLLPPLPCLYACADAAAAGDLVDSFFDASTSLLSWSLLGGLVPPAAPPRGWVVTNSWFADASAAFPGEVWLTLCGLGVTDDIPSSENLSSSSEGITSGPFAPAAAFAVARRGGFVQRLAPSRFEETRGNFPPAVFGCLASAGPPPPTELPSAIAPAVLPTPILRVGPNFGAIVGAIFFYLNWLVHGCFLAKSDLPDGFFTSTNLKGGEHVGTISVPARPYLEDQYLVF
jgi:hypothetical protein